MMCWSAQTAAGWTRCQRGTPCTGCPRHLFQSLAHTCSSRRQRRPFAWWWCPQGSACTAPDCLQPSRSRRRTARTQRRHSLQGRTCGGSTARGGRRALSGGGRKQASACCALHCGVCTALPTVFSPVPPPPRAPPPPLSLGAQLGRSAWAAGTRTHPPHRSTLPPPWRRPLRSGWGRS